MLLGLEASESELETAFAHAASSAVVKGFAIGRTIFAEPMRAWLAGSMDDAAVVEAMADRFRRLIALWERARAARAV